MEFSCRCHSTTGGITSSTLLPFGLWAPGSTNWLVSGTDRSAMNRQKAFLAGSVILMFRFCFVLLLFLLLPNLL